jgi:hypothetical protein
MADEGHVGKILRWLQELGLPVSAEYGYKITIQVRLNFAWCGSLSRNMLQSPHVGNGSPSARRSSGMGGTLRKTETILRDGNVK